MNGASTIRNMIKFSWAKSREILFPFHFKRWLKALIVVWLAGAGIQGFSANFNIPKKSVRSSSVSGENTMAKPSSGISQQGAEQMSSVSPVETPAVAGISTPSTEQIQAPTQNEMRSPSASPNADPMAKIRAGMDRLKSKVNLIGVAWVAAGIISLGVAFAVFFVWLSSRFNFVLLNAILTREPAIGGPFRKHKEAGNSYFAWTLAFMGIGLTAFLSAGLLIMLSLGMMKWSPVIGIPLMILGGLFVLAVVVAVVFVGTIMRDFVLPLMYCEKIPAMSALNKLLRAGTFAFGKAFQYLLVVFGLWILAMIAQSIVGIFAVIGGVIAGGLMAIPGIILINVLPFLKLPLIILGGLAAMALILAVIVVIGMVMLPVVIFFRVFALTYLTRLYPECDLLEFVGDNS
ncbi:MAG: hypothetical protein ABH891_05825 [Candidatus Omnitrophota bacterium]